MTTTARNAAAVIGGQWGDEGKGKIVDLISPSFDLVARYQGGHNAGHTVRFQDKHFALRLIPSGICRQGVMNIVGNGLVIDPRALLYEMETLRAAGVEIGDNLKVSDRAHVILPTHALLDGAREKALGSANIGTTSRGIGPTYESKANRTGIRLADLVDADRFVELARPLLTHQGAVLRHFYGTDAPPVDAILQEYIECGQKLRRFVTDTSAYLGHELARGKKLLCEGAQGVMLDVDHGTYPFVTSSSCGPGGAVTGLGIAPRSIGLVLAVSKAYTTRVGSGPFPTELHDELGDRIRKRGNEFGTVTGRPRRVGWFDAVVARTAARLAGIDGIALTKLDVLDDLDEIPVCVGYELEGQPANEVPARADHYERVRPVLEVFPGWKTSIEGAATFDELPENAQRYVSALEKLTGVPVVILSTGAKREQTILRGRGILDGWLRDLDRT
ncbi:MAG: adenylosuccinate synthase [Acidobacteria bacterium]|nr:adenylosuccinate synthase [Acidobacteriota bacterium]